MSVICAVSFEVQLLVLDDDPDWIDLIRRAVALSRLNLVFVPFLKAEAALAYLRHNRVDLVLSDIRMPEMDGLAFVRLLRRFDRKTPVILVSSEVMSTDEAVAHGANAFVRKSALNSQLTPATKEIVPVKPAIAETPR